jgi:hypothetical protein
MRALKPLSLIIGSVLVFSLSGCFANPVQGLIEGVIENQTGIDVNTGSGGSSAELPAGWPGLPLPDGQIVSAISSDGTYIVSMLTTSEESIESVISQLEGSGYELSSRSDLGEIQAVILNGNEWTVTLGWFPGDDPGTFIVTYGVAPSAN